MHKKYHLWNDHKFVKNEYILNLMDIRMNTKMRMLNKQGKVSKNLKYKDNR